MEEKHIRLTSSEISTLWTGYIADSMALRVLEYFRAKVEDAEIRPILEYALSLTKEHLGFMKELFTNENFPIPHGFTEQDVRLDAPRLFSDTFVLLYLRQMGIAGVHTYAFALSSTARPDIRHYLNHNLQTAAELLQSSTNLLQSKGLFIRAPYIDQPDKAEYVQKESWLNGFFRDRRPLNAAEITHLHMNTNMNTTGKALMIGFSQVAQNKEVVNYCLRGRDIADKHVEILRSRLQDDNLPVPMAWDVEVTDSTIPPFSDKLMLFHTVSLTGLGLGNYGASIAASNRRDLAVDYMRLHAEVGTYADDGVELMIKNHWMEKMPGAIERDALIKR